jgi:SAM-dependent methyltransferase
MILNSRLLANLLAPQFRRPSGILGMYAARFMTGRNIPRTEWAIDKCDIRTGHVVLEIGFGPGYGLAMAAARAADGTVYGLDFSPAMVRMASRRNRDSVAAGKVRIVNGDLSPAPFAADFFDRIVAVNVAYFWPKPERELSEIKRILKPDGKAAFYLSDKASMGASAFTNTGVFTKYTAEEFRLVLSACGFGAIESETRTQFVNGNEVVGHCFLVMK